MTTHKCRKKVRLSVTFTDIERLYRQKGVPRSKISSHIPLINKIKHGQDKGSSLYSNIQYIRKFDMSVVYLSDTSVVTPVKYDVVEHILKKWLEDTFGDQAWYEVHVQFPISKTLYREDGRLLTDGL